MTHSVRTKSQVPRVPSGSFTIPGSCFHTSIKHFHILGLEVKQRLRRNLSFFSSTVSSSLAPTDDRPPLRQRGRHQNTYAGGTVLTRKDWCHLMDLPCSSGSKESAYNAGDLGSILGLGRSSGEGNGKPLQYSCLENPMKRRAWWASSWVSKSQTRLSD